MVFFRILCGIDGLVALVLGWFFFVGLADGSVSSFNIALWLALLAGTAAILGGGIALHAKGRPGAAKLLLSVLAFPAMLCTLFFAVLILSQPHWN